MNLDQYQDQIAKVNIVFGLSIIFSLIAIHSGFMSHGYEMMFSLFAFALVVLLVVMNLGNWVLK